MPTTQHTALIDKGHSLLADSLRDVKKRGSAASRIELQAKAMQKRLLRELPALQQAAETAPQDSPERRDYLRARQNLQRCEQALQIATQQKLTAQAMTGQ